MVDLILLQKIGKAQTCTNGSNSIENCNKQSLRDILKNFHKFTREHLKLIPEVKFIFWVWNVIKTSYNYIANIFQRILNFFRTAVA